MTSTPLKRFTPAELALGDGKEGRPALVGYKGKVYDCTPSKLWKNGKHVNAHHAGHDLTAEMAAAPHMEDVIERYPVVGEIAPATSSPARHIPPPLIEVLLARHPHPISAHFPIALGVIAALFTLITLSMELLSRGGQVYADLRVAGWYLILVGGVLGLPGIFTGLLSWWFNYGGLLNSIYRWKIILSCLLVVLAAAAIWLGWPGAQYLGAGSARHWAYSLSVIAYGPTAVLLGGLGGKIVYP